MKLRYQQIDATYLMHCGNIARIIASVQRSKGVTQNFANEDFRQDVERKLRLYVEITDAPIDFVDESLSE